MAVCDQLVASLPEESARNFTNDFKDQSFGDVIGCVMAWLGIVRIGDCPTFIFATSTSTGKSAKYNAENNM